MSHLDNWQPPGPPLDFADRVMAARGAVEAPRRRLVHLGGAAVIALAIAGIIGVLVIGRSGAAAGKLAPSVRATARLGDRAIVVAEPGSTLDWQVARTGDARVVQDAGDAFYRVEPGGAFVVATPAGEVTVTGTCFAWRC